jgi:Cof subfamily protein (haloacid dehalogenase superfamily)
MGFPEFGLVPFLMEITQDLRFIVRPTSWDESFHEVVKLYATGGDSEIDAAKRKIRALSDGSVSITSSLHGNLEVCPAGVSKASGLAYLADQLDIHPEEIACIGDGENDIEMFGFAGIRVAMGNAVLPLKSLADHVAPSNTEHGIVKALEWILSQTDP